MSAGRPHGFDVRQEEDAVEERTLRRVGVVVVAVSVLAVGVATLVLGKDQARVGGGPAERVKTEGMVAPETLGIIEQTLIEHAATGTDQRRVEEERLHRYGWVDRAHGIAHIPIDVAMNLVLAESSRDAGGAGTAEGGSP